MVILGFEPRTFSTTDARIRRCNRPSPELTSPCKTYMPPPPNPTFLTEFPCSFPRTEGRGKLSRWNSLQQLEGAAARPAVGALDKVRPIISAPRALMHLMGLPCTLMAAVGSPITAAAHCPTRLGDPNYRPSPGRAVPRVCPAAIAARKSADYRLI